MKTFILLLFAIMVVSCRKADDRKREVQLGDSLVIVDGDTIMIDTNRAYRDNTGSPGTNEYAEFGTTDGNTRLRLRDPFDRNSLAGLGTPNDTLTRELTLASDTHRGSTVREYKYNDINLEYFFPKGSNAAWLMSVEIKGGNWSTSRGIKVGDTVDDLKAMYPKISELHDDKNQYSYRYDLEDSSIMFGTAGDKITRIKIRYNIP